ncbi:MAG: alpha/beta hydrolase-fold protein [Bacteroidales bacterium]|jgi:predicted alpha/beta superfamily hydrolase
MKKAGIIIMFLLPFLVSGQATINIKSVPEWYTPLLDTIFISGTFNSWNPADPSYRMIPNTDGTYSITISGDQDSTVQYKFTRGAWTNVETTLNGNDISNRTFIFSNGMTLNDTVENWKDMLGSHTAVGNTKILDLDFAIPQLGRQRRIWVYLPVDYYTTNNHYPVLYMQDGQNLFDEVYCFSQEWGVDESMDYLSSVFSPEAIVVGIDNGPERINEYSPWVNTSYGGGQGDEYVSFICNTLKPFIDSYFRTLPDRENTGIMGSSLGGLISFYGAIKHQDVFSKAGVFSPSFWFSDSVYTFIKSEGHLQNMRIYFVAGTQEDSSMITDMQHVYDTLLSSGFSSAEMNFQTVTGGQHSEYYWSQDYSPAFEWLFQPTVTGIENKDNSKSLITVSEDYQTQLIHINMQRDVAADAYVYNLCGQKLKHLAFNKSAAISCSGFPKGIYLLRINSNKGSQTFKILF